MWVIEVLRFRVFVVFGVERSKHVCGGILAGLRRRWPILRQLRRMRGPVDFLKIADGHVRVNLRSLEISVAEHRLNEACVRTAFEHQRSHRVTKHVARSLLVDLRRLHVHAHEFGEVVHGERLPGIRQEDVVIVGFAHQLRARLLQVFAYPGSGTVTQRNHAILLAFAHTDGERRALQIKVPELQLRQFETPDSGRVEGLQDGSVSGLRS